MHAPSGLPEWSASLAAVGRLSGGTLRDVRGALALAAAFNRDVVRPASLAIDAAVQDDPDYLPHEFIARANEWGLFTRWLPKMFGGAGWSLVSLYVFLEEVSAVCVGLANVIGVHYLGVSSLTATWNMALMARVFADVAAGERDRRPCLISLAITEPGAGTDVEETELLDRARLGTCATRESDGGYRLDGRKVFISNGHVSTWHLVATFEDRHRGADTMVFLAVHRDSPGLTLGAQEDKMGQKACVASELVFEDCRVPPEQVAMEPRASASLGRSHREISQVVIDYVVSANRAGVGAFAAGVARGACESAHHYAVHHRVDGEPLIRRQWVQTLLADMDRNARLARQAYLESVCANALGGLFQILERTPLRQMERFLPRALWRRLSRPVLRLPLTTRLLRRRLFTDYPPAWQRLTSGLASLAKFACSDLAMANADLALELMGSDGLRHDYGAEKRLRDAKLLQIYEGTNQLNRLNLFKCRLAPPSGLRLFVREDTA